MAFRFREAGGIFVTVQDSGGDAYGCFGSGFEMAAAHQRTPTTPAGRMQLIDEVPAFEPSGGPWRRGYLRAEAEVPTDAWFYEGHFKNDPCMPGTLMADASIQAIAFYMAACGFILDKGGWRFEPAPGQTYQFVCRGQVVPDRPHRLVYEVFVEEVTGGDEPTVHAAVLCTCDGLKVFHCCRFGVRLVPDWPLGSQERDTTGGSARRSVGPSGDVPGDPAALLACAWGRPSAAFGSMYRRFDGAARVPRLPGPPYHLVSRIARVDCAPGVPTQGGTVEAEYDVPADAWYFQENGHATMPFCILLETLLQPCGWLASYMGLR